jgi:hypothetical protein
MFDRKSNQSAWINHITSVHHLTAAQKSTLENELTMDITSLCSSLSEEEAFVVVTRRLAQRHGFSLAFEPHNTWRLSLTKPSVSSDERSGWVQLLTLVGFILIAGTLAKLPSWLITDRYTLAFELLVMKNLSLYVLPLGALLLALRRKMSWRIIAGVLAFYAFAAIVINLYPYGGQRMTEVLTGLHLPLLGWLVLGVVYVGEPWTSSTKRMEFIRFSGEAFIYAVLIFMGVMVLSAFTLLIFQSIGVDATSFVADYLLVYGTCAVVLLAIDQIERGNFLGQFAPVLARIFSPLFLIALSVFLLIMVISGQNPLADRNYLIGFDAMLILVLALVVYGISARSATQRWGLSDWINLALIGVALLIDVAALWQILIRLGTMGITPNKMAALGENVLVLGNLVGLGIHLIRILRHQGNFDHLERFQTAYLTIYAGWLAVVAFGFPLLFGFI